MKKRVVSIAIAGILAMVPMSAMGATSDEIQTEIDSTEEELSQTENEKDETLDSQQELQGELDDIDSEITDLNDEMEELGNVTLRDAISDIGLEIVHSLENIFNIDTDPENENQTIREQIEDTTEQIEKLEADLEDVSDELDENTQLVSDLETEQATLSEQLDSLQEEYEKTVAEEEAARKAAEEEAARIAEAEEAARIAAEEEEEAAQSAETESVNGEVAAQAEEESSSGEIPAVEAATSDSYEMPSGSGILTWSGGVNYFDGHMETWYTMREWTGDLGIPGMYIGKDGIVRDCDNYICVASDDDPKGTILETSLGTAKVYDCGPGHGIIDIYTDWPLY